MAQVELNGVRKFEANGEPTQLGQAWKRWLRSFEFFATGKGVTDKGQKKALLLHCAGPEVQDIYFALVSESNEVEHVAGGVQAQGQDGGGEDEDEAEVPAPVPVADEYAEVIKLLTNHFQPKVNVTYERYCFRTMKQEEAETVKQFCTRLRRQAMLCEFDRPDEEIRDQIVEKCKSNKLRTKFLERGQTLSLEKLLMIASTMEMSQKQAKFMEEAQASGINRIRSVSSGSNDKKQTNENKSGKKCFRCGKEGHFAKDTQCPARDKRCKKCGLKGHYAVCCKTKEKGKQSKKTVNLVESNSSDEYAFTVRNNEESAKIKLNVGGNLVDMIIDSGATVNIIDSVLWKELKSKKIKCQSEKTNVKLFAYGCEQPLSLLGKFKTNVSVADRDEQLEAEFYVTESRGSALLGKDTAARLGVLKPGINHVTNNICETYNDCFGGVTY